MKKDLLSLTDENSILITAEFLESGRRLSTGKIEVQRIELDLIVNKYITCQQLLEAVGKGLENLLWKHEVPPGSQAYEKALESIYQNIYYDQSLVSNHAPFSFLGKVKRRFEDQKQSQLEIESDALDADGYPDENILEEWSADLKEKYLICWSVYQECMAAYRSNYNGLADDIKVLETYDKELMGTDYIRSHPVIGRGSINRNAVGKEELMSISSRPQCWLFCKRDSTRTLADLGFITATRLVFDPILWHHSAPLFDERESNPVITPAFQGKTPEYNISDRPLKKLDDEKLIIIEPTAAPEWKQQSLLSTLLPVLLSTGTLVAVRMLVSTGGNEGKMIVMTGAMCVASVAVSIVNSITHKREYVRSANEWCVQYQDYIERLLDTIVQRQANDVELLHKLYPPALMPGSKRSDSLVSKILTVNGDIYSRGPSHPDFLSVRLGVSKEQSHLVPSVFEIEGNKKETLVATHKYKNIFHQKGKPFRILKDGKSNLAIATDGSEGYLTDLPGDIAEHYRYLQNAPVMVKLDQCGALGIVYGDRKKEYSPFLDNILLDLCFYHSPEDLQFVMFCEKTDDWSHQQSMIRRYKHLPHFRQLLGDLSPFVFREQDAHRVFNKLSEILAERKDAGSDARFPHIIVFFQHEYSLKRHPFSQFLPEYGENGVVKTDGLSFVFCAQYTEQLPKFCGQVIYTSKEDEHLLLPHTLLIPSFQKDRNSIQLKPSVSQKMDIPFHPEYYSYKPDPVVNETSLIRGKEQDDEYLRAFKILSALHYERIAQGADMPSNLSLFDMMRHTLGIQDNGNQATAEGDAAGQDNETKNFLKPLVEGIGFADTAEKNKSCTEKIRRELRDYIMSQWGIHPDTGKGLVPDKHKRDIVNSLAVPIGENTQGIVTLDLHERGDGPHMLVAGTTGSGKTETILTYLINLCAQYTPEQVNLLLMDMKGEDFVKRLQGLPHVVGMVSDVDGDKTGTNTAYMLKRFLLSMNAEVKRRKVMLSKMDVKDISSYNAARENLNEHIRSHHIPEKRWEDLRKMKPMPHLFLVIDEFTELMQFTSENGGVDFKTAITSLARVGRSLGFHIILISQNIENAITPDIRVNSRARLCLKVATRDASKEMIGSDLAASPLMPGNGRAYLLVGTGSRFEYFQSGYSGGNILGDPEAPVLITHAATTGEYQSFYNSETQKVIDKERYEVTAEECSAEEGAIAMEEKGTAAQASQTQIQLLREVIKDDVWQSEACRNIIRPHQVFRQPLPTKCCFDFDWNTGKGQCMEITKDINAEEAR